MISMLVRKLSLYKKPNLQAVTCAETACISTGKLKSTAVCEYYSYVGIGPSLNERTAQASGHVPRS